MKHDANDVAALSGVDGLRQQIESAKEGPIREALAQFGWSSFDALAQRHQSYRPHVIRGLLREGETMNLIASPKVGKSWLCYWLALAVINGGSWLQSEWHCRQGQVVLVDNELHPETLAVRLETVRLAAQLPESVRRNLHICTLRGRNVTIDDLPQYLAPVRHFKPKLIILDSLYRFLPPGVSENDNAAITQIYNKIDKMAREGDAAFAVVHHASKGDQGNKSVTDVGSGAGAQSRACDTHLTIRDHEEDDHFVISAVTRTWKRPEDFTVEWDWPRWNLSTLSPKSLRGRRAQGGRQPKPDLGELDDAAMVSYMNGDWMNRTQLVRKICDREGCARRNAEHRVDEVSERHRLKNLKAGEEKDCGVFIACSRHGVKFKTKTIPGGLI